MENIASIVVLVGVLVFLAHFFTGIFSRTRIPTVLLLIAIGFFFGPVFGLVSPAEFGIVGPVFTTIAIIILLFWLSKTSSKVPHGYPPNADPLG